MARHSLYPGFIRIHYTSNTHTHRQVLPINADPTPVGDSFTIPTKGSGAVDWQTAVAAWAALIAPLFDTASTIDYAELYNYEAEPAPADFLQAVVLGVDGTSEGADKEFAQLVMPFKGVGGTSLRPYFMETVFPPDEHYPFHGSADSRIDDIEDFVLSADAWMCTRAGGFATVSLGYVTKTNDQLRKRYFNP